MTSAILVPSLRAGSDIDVANAARRSFDRWNPELTEGDRSLIWLLAREGHLLPFRHPQLSFSCEAPIPVARALGKQPTGGHWSSGLAVLRKNGLIEDRPGHLSVAAVFLEVDGQP